MPFRTPIAGLLALTLLLGVQTSLGQLIRYETHNAKLVYTSPLQAYLVPRVARSFENSLRFHSKLFDYIPSEPVTVLMHDLWHYGNAGARPVPHNHITVGIAPYGHAFETSPGIERMSSSMNHEMVHLVTTDKAAGRDVFFRHLFGGKVTPSAEDPVSIVWSYLTTPRWYTPRWYLEGIAVYLETWMNGGLGRAIGAYDEMVFRSMVRDSAYIYDVVGLESEGTTVDFQVGVNSYLYGTRFVTYLAYTYGQDKLIQWYNRTKGSRPSYLAQFRKVYGTGLDDEWSRWISWEKAWQTANLRRINESRVTTGRRVSRDALGAVSRGYLDATSNELYVAVRYPGQVAHIAAINVDTGRLRRVSEIIGAAGFSVTSLAFDPDSRTLFYTTNNRNWRNLRSLGLDTGRNELLLKDFRTGDLAFSRPDRSLWGVRHFNGISTLVRIPYPYTEWNQIYSLPYGFDLFDLDVSPDGATIIGSLMDISGKQKLVRMKADSLLAGQRSYEELFDFGNWEPANFVFSPDGRFLFGSSYFSGVSNIFRYSIDDDRMNILSNAETGYFRPVPVSGDSLVAFEYTGRGFVPVMIPNAVPDTVSTTRFLGNEIGFNDPVVQSWAVPSPETINIDSLVTFRGAYSPLGNFRLDSVYPITEGYQDILGNDAPAVGLRMNFSDRVGFTGLTVKASYSLDTSLDAEERLHLAARLAHKRWTVGASWNRADFYDLFGPTKTSRKGYALTVGHRRTLLFDDPKELSLSVNVGGYGRLATLPEYQNVESSFDRLVSASASLDYENLRKSLGAVENELGVAAGLRVSGNFVRGDVFPRASGSLALGSLLPIHHSSVWLRLFGGTALSGPRDEPFASFFFGGFGNNWIDHGSIRRFRDGSSFPGVEINEVGGRNYARGQFEWVLPPVRFRRVGLPGLYARWASLSLFSTGILTNLDKDDLRTWFASFGGQVDVRLISFSSLRSTFSVGFALATAEGGGWTDEVMVSFKIL